MRQLATRVNRRCERHGLVVFNDGACLLCDAEQRHRRRRHIGGLAIASVVAFGALTSVVVRSPVSGRFRAAVPNKDDDSLTLVANHWMDFWATSARNPLIAKGSATPSSHDDHAARADAAAEECSLGKAVRTPPASIPVPPAPPRALVDPEPESPDSPADFELPR